MKDKRGRGARTPTRGREEKNVRKCHDKSVPFPSNPILSRAIKRPINFEHINFLKVGTTLGQPDGNQRQKFIFPVFRGEHINFLARLTLGQPAVCPRAIWTLTRAKCLCAFFLPNCQRPPRPLPLMSFELQKRGKLVREVRA